MLTAPYGFRIVGGCHEDRRLVNAAAAFSAHASCDDKAQLDRECYLSAFQFGTAFKQHLTATGSTKGYDGECWGPWLWFDIDREDLEQARRDTARLVLALIDRYNLSDERLLIFFSGSKGFHIGVPTTLWQPGPSNQFHRVSRTMAETLAGIASVRIDSGVYDRVRAFRAPNSRHPKTGLHKRCLSFDELQGLSLAKIADLATSPAPFDIPDAPDLNALAVTDWQASEDAAHERNKAGAARRVANGSPTLNRQTLEFMREGAPVGDRHRRLFSAAANLGEGGCPLPLALALLEEPARDAGLTPKDIRRTIECGFSSVNAEPARNLLPPAEITSPVPLPRGAIAAGKLETPCRCGATEFAEFALSEGRTRRDCRKCGKFITFGTWQEEGR